MSEFISVIITTYNRADLLRRALFSLQRQNISKDKFEIIVIDDGSTDDTSKICNQLQDHIPNLNYLSNVRNYGTSISRNRGIYSAKGNYIMLLDHDCIASENWIDRLSHRLENEPLVAGAILTSCGNYLKLSHNIGQFHQVMPGRKAGQIQCIAAANMGMHRAVFQDVGGFQARSICEDTEWIIRAHLKGYRPFFAPDAKVTHDPDRTTFTRIMKYAADHARSTIILRNQHNTYFRTPFFLKKTTWLMLLSPLIAMAATFRVFIHNKYARKFIHTAPIVLALKLAWCLGAVQGLRKLTTKQGEFQCQREKCIRQ